MPHAGKLDGSHTRHHHLAVGIHRQGVVKLHAAPQLELDPVTRVQHVRLRNAAAGHFGKRTAEQLGAEHAAAHAVSHRFARRRSGGIFRLHRQAAKQATQRQPGQNRPAATQTKKEKTDKHARNHDSRYRQTRQDMHDSPAKTAF